MLAQNNKFIDNTLKYVIWKYKLNKEEAESLLVSNRQYATEIIIGIAIYTEIINNETKKN